MVHDHKDVVNWNVSGWRRERLVIWSKGTWYFVFTERICLLCPNMAPPFQQESPKQDIISCKSGASLVGHDQSGLCMGLKTAVNLLAICTFNKSLLGSSYIHFLIYEWNDSYDIMWRSTGVSWRYSLNKQIQ